MPVAAVVTVSSRLPGLLDLLPARLHLRDVPGTGVPEHVRMPADKLVDQVTRDRVDVEPAGRCAFGGDPRVEDHLQQDVAELLAHGGRVVVDDLVVGLVRFLEQVAAQRRVGLLGVPGAASG